MNINIEIHNGIYVLRDDKLLGGTKSVFIEKLLDPDATEYVYASPVYGGFQIALSGVCKRLEKKAIIFCPKRSIPHPNSLKCKSLGATVYQVPYGYLSNIQAKSRVYCSKSNTRQLLPFGADSPVAINAIAERTKEVVSILGFEPENICCAIGSGTLVRGILEGTTKSKVIGVRVGKASKIFNERLQVIDYGKPFEACSNAKAPFPSCENYDLKAWETLLRLNLSGTALFWNVL